MDCGRLENGTTRTTREDRRSEIRDPSSPVHRWSLFPLRQGTSQLSFLLVQIPNTQHCFSLSPSNDHGLHARHWAIPTTRTCQLSRLCIRDDNIESGGDESSFSEHNGGRLGGPCSGHLGLRQSLVSGGLRRSWRTRYGRFSRAWSFLSRRARAALNVMSHSSSGTGLSRCRCPRQAPRHSDFGSHGSLRSGRGRFQTSIQSVEAKL